MGYGLPSQPPPEIEFDESVDDVHCPDCGKFDVSDSLLDHNKAHNQGVLLAVEQSERTPFGTMGTQLVAFYWKCPTCSLFFTTEEENSYQGGMS